MKVNISRIKSFVTKRLPPSDHLRNAILSEKDQMDPEELLHKIDVWLKLFSAGG